MSVVGGECLEVDFGRFLVLIKWEQRSFDESAKILKRALNSKNLDLEKVYLIFGERVKG